MKQERWIVKVFVLSFFLALIFGIITNVATNNVNQYLLGIITLIVAIIGMLFDMIGTAVLTSKEATFHAKASKKIKGAKETIKLIKNSEKVASVCNDIVGDVCGIVSGGLSTVLATVLATNLNINLILIVTVTTALVSSVTVGGKAIGKKVAIKNSDEIIFKVGEFISNFTKK